MSNLLLNVFKFWDSPNGITEYLKNRSNFRPEMNKTFKINNKNQQLR